MDVTEQLIVKIQPRFEGSSDPLAFFDISSRIDAEGFEFSTSADGATASANINIFTLFPLSEKRWSDYASESEALLDPMFYFPIPSRTEIQIYESNWDSAVAPKLLFGGIVLQVAEERIGGGIIQRITCADYTALLDERVVESYRVPRDTFGWEMIKGGVSYEDGLVGISRLSSAPDDTPVFTITQDSYDSVNNINYATCANHNFLRGERFVYEPTGTEYEIIGVAENKFFYRRSSNTGSLSLSGPFKIWSHKVTVKTVEDHLYSKEQLFKFPNITLFASSFYAVHDVENSTAFNAMHRVASANATSVTPFTDVTVANISLVSAIDPRTKSASATSAFLTSSVEHGFVAGGYAYFTQAQQTLIAPWLDALTVAPAGGGLYRATVTEVIDPYVFAITNSVGSAQSDTVILDYDDGYPITTQAYTRSIFEAIRNNDPFKDTYDSIGVDYTTLVREIETKRYNPILYSYDDAYPNKLKDAAKTVGSAARIWIDFSGKGTELQDYSFDPLATSGSSPIRHIGKINNRASNERKLGKTYNNVSISYNTTTNAITLGVYANLADGEDVLINNITPAPIPDTAGDIINISNTELRVTGTPCVIDLDHEDNQGINQNFTISAGATCSVTYLPTHNVDSGTLKIYTDRPHSLVVGQDVTLENYRINAPDYDISDNVFDITAVTTENAGASESSVTLSVGAVDPQLELYPNAKTNKNLTTTLKPDQTFLSAKTNRHRVIHARRESGISQLTLISAEIITGWAATGADSMDVQLDVEADGFFEYNQIVRIMSLPGTLKGRWKVQGTQGKVVSLRRVGQFGAGSSYYTPITAATYSAPNITYTSTAHGLKVGQTITVTGLAPNAWNVTNAEINQVATNTFRVAAQGGTPGTITDSSGAAVVSQMNEDITVTAISRALASGIWTTTYTAVNHNLSVGDAISVNIFDTIDELAEEGGSAVVATVPDGKTFTVRSSGTGAASSSSPESSITVSRVLTPSHFNTGTIGLLVSRVDDAYAEQEAFFVENTGSSNFDSSVPMRSGGIKRVEVRTETGATATKLHWAPTYEDGKAKQIVTLYFGKNISEAARVGLQEGRSAYFDIEVAALATNRHAFSGIYTIFDAGEVAADTEHAARATIGTRYIRYMNSVDAAVAGGLYTVDEHGVISADYLEYIDGRANVSDTEPYTIAEPDSKSYVPKERRLALSSYKYMNNGRLQLTTTTPHKLRVGNKVYFTGTTTSGITYWNENRQKRVAAVLSPTKFSITADQSSFVVRRVKSSASSQTWNIYLTKAANQLLISPAVKWNITGIGRKKSAAVKGLKKVGGWSVYTYNANKKIITITNGPAHVQAIDTRPGPNAILKFKASTSAVSLTNATLVNTNNTVSVTREVWSYAKMQQLFSKPAGVSELNYVNDLKITRENSASVYIKYYPWADRAITGTYTATGGVYTVTTTLPHNLGTFQPGVHFKASGGAWFHISSTPDVLGTFESSVTNGIKVTGDKTFTFTKASDATVTTPTHCDIKTRLAYTPDASHPSMPRNPLSYIGGRTAAKFIGSEWTSLIGNAMYMDTKRGASVGTTHLDATWTFVLQTTELPSAGTFAAFTQHGARGRSPHVSFGINSSGNPWILFTTGAGGATTRYTANNITFTAEEDAVLQYRIVHSSPTAATVYVSKNTKSEQALSVTGIYRTIWGTDSADTYGPGTLIVGAETLTASDYQNPFTGLIGEIIAFDRDIGLSDGLKLRAWTMHKWSLISAIDEGLTPDYRDIRYVPNQELPDSKQVKNAQFGGRTLKQVLQVIAENAGAQFWVDKDRKLHYQQMKPKNLIKNSIFQDSRAVSSSEHWTIGSWSLATQDPADSSKQPGPWGYGFALSKSGTTEASAHSAFITEDGDKTPVAANQYYFASAYVKTTDKTKAALRVHFYNSATNTVGDSNSMSYSAIQSASINNDWQKVWGIVKTPTNTAKLTVGLTQSASDTTVSTYYTNVLLVRLSGEYGFADEGYTSDGQYKVYLNNGETTNSVIPMPTYAFESPDAIRSAGAVANRLYLYASVLDTDSDGGNSTAENAGQAVLEYTYDFVQGIWAAHGKIIEASQAEDRAATATELAGKASAFWEDNGKTINSYEFDHPYNGSNAMLTVGSVVPYIWSEVGVIEPMIVKSHKTTLIGSELYHRVALEQEPDYQKNALVLISRRKMQVDLANAPEARDIPPPVRNFKVASFDDDGQLRTITSDYQMNWDYPFDDPKARGVRESGFEIQTRWRKRAYKVVSKKQMGNLANEVMIAFSATSNGTPVEVRVQARSATFNVVPGQIVRVMKTGTYDPKVKGHVQANGKWRVHKIWKRFGKTVAFSYLVPAPTEIIDGETKFITAPVRRVKTSAVSQYFQVAFTKKQGGSFSEWKSINQKILGTQFIWDPSSGSGVLPASYEQIAIYTSDQDLDFQFRIRAKATNSSNISVYSVYTQYPLGDDAIGIATTQNMEE